MPRAGPETGADYLATSSRRSGFGRSWSPPTRGASSCRPDRTSWSRLSRPGRTPPI